MNKNSENVLTFYVLILMWNLGNNTSSDKLTGDNS